MTRFIISERPLCGGYRQFSLVTSNDGEPLAVWSTRGPVSREELIGYLCDLADVAEYTIDDFVFN